MHVRSLKVFCDVVRRRSFSQAASDNKISQSGASQIVHQLEERLDVKLIDRSKRPFVLTPEGSVFYDGCCSLVERYQSLVDKVRSLHQEVAGRVRVASIYSIGLHHMNQIIQDFMRAYPRANVRLEYLHPSQVYRSVENDVADLGLVSYPRHSRTIEAISWREEPMVVVSAPDHLLTKYDEIELGQISGERMIGFDRGLAIRREIDRLLHQHQIEVDVVMEFDNIETIKRAIEIDAGIALLPEPTVQREVAAGTLVATPLVGVELFRPIGIIYRRGKELSPTALRFIDLLQSMQGSELSDTAGARDENGEPSGPEVDQSRLDTRQMSPVAGEVVGNLTEG